MNQNRKEELLTRWMDDALSDEELRELQPVLDESPDLYRERDEYVRLRQDLRKAVPVEVEPPYPDFFNTHLERLVQSEGLAGHGGEKSSRSGIGRLWSWWLAPAATAALVAAFVAGMKLNPENVPAPLAEATAVYSPMENVEASAIRDEDLDATVIVLTGLEEIGDQELIGWSGSHLAAPEFFVSTGETF